MGQSMLTTERLSLVPLSELHLEHEVELDSDPEVMRFLGAGRARTRSEVEDLHRHRLSAGQRVPGLGFWVGFVDDAFIGWWILEPPEADCPSASGGEAELGYRLLRRYWRQGLASEGARELLRHGFEDLGLSRIFAETMSINAASRATMATIGMEEVRTYPLEPGGLVPGSELGGVEYAIRREQWRSRWAGCTGGSSPTSPRVVTLALAARRDGTADVGAVRATRAGCRGDGGGRPTRLVARTATTSGGRGERPEQSADQ